MIRLLTSLHTIQAGLSIDEVLEASAELQQRIAAAVAADPTTAELNESQSNPFSMLRKKVYRTSVTDYVTKLAADFSAHTTMPPAVLSFFIERLEKQFITGGKFRKNDVIDLLLAHVELDDNTLLVSNDDGILAAMQSMASAGYTLSMTLRRP